MRAPPHPLALPTPPLACALLVKFDAEERALLLLIQFSFDDFFHSSFFSGHQHVLVRTEQNLLEN